MPTRRRRFVPSVNIGASRRSFIVSKGAAAALQVQQAEGSLAQVEATVPALEIDLDAALNSLDVLLGSQPGTHRAELIGRTPIPTAPAIANAVGPADLIRRRPDLVVAERQLQASNARIGVALAEYYPKFSFRGLIGSAATQSSQLYTGNAGQWQSVLGLRRLGEQGAAGTKARGWRIFIDPSARLFGRRVRRRRGPRSRRIAPWAAGGMRVTQRRMARSDPSGSAAGLYVMNRLFRGSQCGIDVPNSAIPESSCIRIILFAIGIGVYLS